MKNKIKEARFFAEMIQDELHLKTGLSQAKISRIERGYIKPSKEDKRLIAKALKKSVKDIFPEEQKLKEERQFLSIKQAAAKSSLSARFLYEACARKELRFFKVGKRIVIDSEDLDEFIQRGVVEPVNWEEKAKELLK